MADFNIKIPLDSIELSQSWNREKLGDIKGLVQSLKETGQKTPLIVRKHPTKTNKVLLVDGRRRYAALQEAGILEALVVYSSDETVDAAYETSVIANMARKEHNPWEKSCIFQKMVDDGKSVKYIAKVLAEISEGSVSQYLAAQRVHKRLQAALKAEKISLTVIRHFIRLDYETDAAFYDQLMDKVIEGGMSAQEAGDRVDLYLNRKGGKSKESGKKTKGKKRSGPELKLTDYSQPESAKVFKMMSKEQTRSALNKYTEKARTTASKRKRLEFTSIIRGLEIAAGIILED